MYKSVAFASNIIFLLRHMDVFHHFPSKWRSKKHGYTTGNAISVLHVSDKHVKNYAEHTTWHMSNKIKEKISCHYCVLLLIGLCLKNELNCQIENKHY